MPQFEVGQSKTARVRMKNPTGKAFNYSGSIYLSLIPVSEKLFSLGAGEEKDVSFPVVIPDRVGTHPVHIGVFSDSTPVALFQATEGVTISPAGIDLDILKILSVEGIGFSRVGPGFGELVNPLIRPSLSGVKILYFNKSIVPYASSFNASNDFERWNWWMSFEPQFETGEWVWVENPDRPDEGYWYWDTPAMPTYMNRPIYTPTNFPPIGRSYEVSITGLHSGGRTNIPGLYDGIFFFQQVYMDYMSGILTQWRIKNMVRVTG